MEEKTRTMEEKIIEVEKMAKKRGIIASIMEFGLPLAILYSIAWGGCLAGLYMLLETEVVSWKDTLRPIMKRMGVDSYAENIDPTMGNFVIAFLVNEMIEPIRFPLVLAAVRPFSRYLARFRSTKV